jgi:ferredoxin
VKSIYLNELVKLADTMKISAKCGLGQSVGNAFKYNSWKLQGRNHLLKQSKTSKKMVNLTINHQKVSVNEGTTVLAAAKKLNINIPTLCNHDDLCVAGNCRVCVVEQTGARTLIASCATPVFEGMEINTNTSR